MSTPTEDEPTAPGMTGKSAEMAPRGPRIAAPTRAKLEPLPPGASARDRLRHVAAACLATDDGELGTCEPWKRWRDGVGKLSVAKTAPLLHAAIALLTAAPAPEREVARAALARLLSRVGGERLAAAAIARGEKATLARLAAAKDAPERVALLRLLGVNDSARTGRVYTERLMSDPSDEVRREAAIRLATCAPDVCRVKRADLERWLRGTADAVVKAALLRIAAAGKHGDLVRRGCTGQLGRDYLAATCRLALHQIGDRPAFELLMGWAERHKDDAKQISDRRFGAYIETLAYWADRTYARQRFYALFDHVLGQEKRPGSFFSYVLVATRRLPRGEVRRIVGKHYARYRRLWQGTADMARDTALDDMARLLGKKR